MKKDTIKEIDYPRKDLEVLIPVLKKIIDEHAGVVTRSMLANMFKVSETGGGFSHIVYSLKLYKIVDKEGQSDFKVNDLGKGVVKGNKNATQKAILNVPIFRSLNERYHTTIPKSTTGVKEFIMKHGTEKSTANTIATRFIKNMKYLDTLEGGLIERDDVVQTEEGKTIISDFQTYKTLADLKIDLTLEKTDFEEAIKKIKELKLPAVSGNDLVNNFSNLKIEDDKQKIQTLLIILDILLNTYSESH